MADAPKNVVETLTSIAKRWGVSKMCVSKWKSLGYIVHDDKSLADSLLKSDASDRVKTKAMEFTSGFASAKADSKGDDIAEVQVHAGKTTLQTIEQIEGDIRRYEAMQFKADREGDEKKVEYAANQKLKFQKVHMEIRLKLKRMGEEQGKQISKAEFERVLGAMASRTALGIHQLMPRIVKVVQKSDTTEEALNKLEPIALMVLFVDPWVKAAGVAAGCGLPAWVVDGFKVGLGDHIEDGERFMEEAKEAG